MHRRVVDQQGVVQRWVVKERGAVVRRPSWDVVRLVQVREVVLEVHQRPLEGVDWVSWDGEAWVAVRQSWGVVGPMGSWVVARERLESHHWHLLQFR